MCTLIAGMSWLERIPQGSSVPKHGVCRVSAFIMKGMVFDRYLVFVYLDP